MDSELNQMYSNNTDSNEVYISAIPSPRDDGKSLNSFFNYYAAEDLPDIVSSPNTKLESLVKDPWMTAPCKLCERQDWSGDRYTCLYCPMLTLCHQCFHTGYHQNHPILITKDTKNFSRKLMQLVRVVVATVPWETTTLGPMPKANADETQHPALPPRSRRIEQKGKNASA